MKMKKEEKYEKVVFRYFSNVLDENVVETMWAKEVDQENKDGYFIIYKRIISRLKDMIIDLNSSYPYPASLASTIVEGALHQHFLKDHFKSITDCGNGTSPTQFYTDLTLNLLKKSNGK